MPISTVIQKESQKQAAKHESVFPTLSLSQARTGAPSLLPCDLSKCTRRQIQEYFENTNFLDEYLFSAIIDEKYLLKCPDRLRLPLIFYLAHPSTLYVNKLLLAGLITKRIDRSFETMFETGVDEMFWDDTENYRMGGAYQWPGLQEVMEYRRTVKQLVIDLINSAPLELPVTLEHPWWSLFMGMEHERIHLETSSVLIRQLPVDYVKQPNNWQYAPLSMDVPAGKNAFVKVPPGKVTVGKPLNFPSYGWDNEYGKIDVEVEEFEATQYLITNGEFLDFVNDGGYENKEHWSEEGWQWVLYRQACHPMFWVCSDGCKSGCGADLATYTHCNLPKEEKNGFSDAQAGCKYRYRAMFDVLPMPYDWPVDVNYHEAKAFCSWKGPSYRLSTEAEHHRLRGEPPPSSETACDPAFTEDIQANTNLKYGSSSPVNMFPPNSMGFYDVYGNVWKWCEDHINGLPGFKSHYLYDDFTSPCFDGRHTLILGGSWISTGDETSRFARYAFRRHFLQHAGFRVVRSASSLSPPVRLCKAEVFIIGCGVTNNTITLDGVDEEQACVNTTNLQYDYESTQNLEQMLYQQYGQLEQCSIPLMELVDDAVHKYSVSTNSAINFGCGAGLTAFLLSNTFQKVVGVDFSGRFVDAAMEIQAGKVLQYGSKKQVAKCPTEAEPSRVQFKQLTWTPNELEGFDVVMFEFLDRLNEPKGWMYKLWEVLTAKGLAVFSSDSWDSKIIHGCIGKWFTLMEENVIADKKVSVWQMK